MILSIFLITVVSAFYLRSLRNILYQVFLWQLKEYRLDRLTAHLKTPIGRKLALGYLPLIKWFLLLLTYGLAVMNIYLPVQNYTYPLIIYGFYAVWLVWFLEAVRFIGEIIQKRARIPKWTIKTLSLVSLGVLFQLYLFWLNPLAPLFLGIIFDKLLPLSLVVFIFIFSLPTAVYKNALKFLARRKIRTLKNLTIIGITGSYGKTSTKEFLAALLALKFKTGTTSHSQNTVISLARFILKNLDASYKYLIVEAAAYKKGEIAELTSIAAPNLALISGIGNQHLELFGSMQKLINAKYELIQSLQQKSRVLFNAESRDIAVLIERARKDGHQIVKVSEKEYFRNVRIRKDCLEFNFSLNGRIKKLKVSLTGRRLLENLALAVAACKYSGLTANEIIRGLKRIQNPAHTMEIISRSKKLTRIDDTFNVNDKAVLQALDYLKLYRGFKILVLTPLIELGSEAGQVHRNLGRKLGKTCDYLILTNNNFLTEITYGLNENGQTITKVIKSPEQLPPMKDDSVIIYEGKEAYKYV